MVLVGSHEDFYSRSEDLRVSMGSYEGCWDRTGIPEGTLGHDQEGLEERIKVL